MKMIEFYLVLALISGAVACTSMRDAKEKDETSEHLKKLNDRFNGFGFDRFR